MLLQEKENQFFWEDGEIGGYRSYIIFEINDYLIK